MSGEHTFLFLLPLSIVIKSCVEVLCHLNDYLRLCLLFHLRHRLAHQLSHLLFVPLHLRRFFTVHFFELMNSIDHSIEFWTEFGNVTFTFLFRSQSLFIRRLVYKDRWLSDFNPFISYLSYLHLVGSEHLFSVWFFILGFLLFHYLACLRLLDQSFIDSFVKLFIEHLVIVEQIDNLNLSRQAVHTLQVWEVEFRLSFLRLDFQLTERAREHSWPSRGLS